MCRLGGSRGAIGGAVLVASKVLRALALLAGYRVLADGLSSVLFAAATLGFTSVVLLVLQRPWTGKELSTKHTVKVAVQSLLLGSSSEGIHLHDIVLHYLRKRLSAGEMRKLHTQVVDGMVMASRERMASIGASFEDTGSTAKPFEGEEVDWYW